MSRAAIRVGFLALQAPGISPSQRYRVEAFLPWLERRGITVRYEWLLDRDHLQVFYGRGSVAAKAGVALRAALSRLRSVTTAPGLDAFFVQREAFFLGGPWSERLAGLRAPIIFDFDDAIWIRQVSEANQRFAWLKNVTKSADLVRLARTTIAGNAYLAEWAQQYSSRVRVVPTCVDTNHFTPPPSRPTTGSVTIAWSGSATTIPHLRRLLPVLERITAAYGDRVRIRVMGDASFVHEPLGLRGEPWSPAAELALLRDTDIGVMPLPDDAWTRGKCGLKGLVSMAVGAATVMSPVGVNAEIVSHDRDGLLAASNDEWYDALSRLIEDGALRQRLGLAGRARVEREYSVQRWEETLADIVREAAG